MTHFVIKLPDTVPWHAKARNEKSEESEPSRFCVLFSTYYKVAVFVLLLLGVMVLVDLYCLSPKEYEEWKQILIVVFFFFSFLLGVVTQRIYAEIKDGRPQILCNVPEKAFGDGTVKKDIVYYETF